MVGVLDRIDDDRAQRPEHGDRLLHHQIRACVLAHEVARDADARALQRAALQMRRVVALEPALALLRRLILGIDAGHHSQRDRDAVDAAGHRAARVEGERQRHDAGAAQQAVRGLEADDAVGERGTADGAAGVGAQADLRECGGNGRSRAAARASGAARQVVRVQGLAAGRTEAIGNGARLDDGGVGRATDAATTARELVQVHFGDHHRAGRSKPHICRRPRSRRIQVDAGKAR